MIKALCFLLIQLWFINRDPERASHSSDGWDLSDYLRMIMKCKSLAYISTPKPPKGFRHSPTEVCSKIK